MLRSCTFSFQLYYVTCHYETGSSVYWVRGGSGLCQVRCLMTFDGHFRCTTKQLLVTVSVQNSLHTPFHVGYALSIIHLYMYIHTYIHTYTHTHILPLSPTQLPIQWVPRAPSPRVNRPEREADHSPSSSAKVKNAWRYTTTPPIYLHAVMLN
jgi:hypothetical protein